MQRKTLFGLLAAALLALILAAVAMFTLYCGGVMPQLPAIVAPLARPTIKPN